MRVHTETVLRLTDDPYEYILVSDASYEYGGEWALADRSIQAAGQNNARDAGSIASGYGTQAAGIGSNIVPYEERQLQNPIGFTPTQENNQLVAGEQGAGGATAGITGEAGLQALRTRNSGALSGVLDQAARTKQQQLSQNALGVKNDSARLGEQKQSQALSGLEGLYGTDVSSQLNAMGIQNQDYATALNAEQTGWQDTFLKDMKVANSLGVKFAGAPSG